MTIMALPGGYGATIILRWMNQLKSTKREVVEWKHINIGHLEHYSQCLALFIPATKEQNQVINILRLVLWFAWLWLFIQDIKCFLGKRRKNWRMQKMNNEPTLCLLGTKLVQSLWCQEKSWHLFYVFLHFKK